MRTSVLTRTHELAFPHAFVHFRGVRKTMMSSRGRKMAILLGRVPTRPGPVLTLNVIAFVSSVRGLKSVRDKGRRLGSFALHTSVPIDDGFRGLSRRACRDCWKRSESTRLQ